MQVVYLHPRRVDEVTDADVQPLCTALAVVGECTLQTLFAHIDTDNSGTFSSADVGAPLAHAGAEANTCPRHHGAMVFRAEAFREGRLVDCIPGYVGSAAHCWSHTMREAWVHPAVADIDDNTVVPGDCDGHPHPVVDQYGCWEHIPGDCDNVVVDWDDGRQKQLWRDRGMSPTVDEDGDGSVSLTEFARWLSSYRVRSKPSLSFGGTIDTGPHAIIGGGGSDGTGALTLVGRTNITMETLKCASPPLYPTIRQPSTAFRTSKAPSHQALALAFFIATLGWLPLHLSLPSAAVSLAATIGTPPSRAHLAPHACSS